MNDIISLVIPFIALIFLIGLQENLIQFLENLINKTIPQGLAYVLIAFLSYFIAMFGDYRFFNYLAIYFAYDWMDWLMSALVIAAGSNFLQRKFDIINTIPSVITGLRVGSTKKSKNNKDDKPTI